MILPNVTVTAAAEKFIRRMVRFSDHPAGGFRLEVSPGGCSGYSSEFAVVPAPLEGDAELMVNGTRVFLPAQSRLLLDGATMDFEDTPVKSGLTFMVPNGQSCGCSSSGDAAPPPAVSTFSLSSLKRV